MTSTEATELVTEIVPFTAADGMELNLHHVRGPQEPWRGPVILAPGAGVRANLFRAPESVNIVDALVADGWDVWLENWRASIDLPLNDWDLDQAAVLDHPRAVACIIDKTGADTVKALIHCQGSSSFALSAVSGLLPQVDRIVSNAMSLHPVIPRWSQFKITQVVPRITPIFPRLNPRWGTDRPSRWVERAMVAMVNATHRECDNGSCKMVSFTYGSGRPALWAHENLSARTHEWLRAEFGSVPLTFFNQMGASVRRGRLMPTGKFRELPADPMSGPPQTDARFTLIAGEHNRCFLPASQHRTFEYLDSYRRGYHRIHEIRGYGHLDIFMGRYSARDVFPLILEELSA
ncbi:hypothetical protein MMAG44476_12971 [Mycolicibacterium mageritense DSM 44476 = CIP 104973]|uniref:Esterase n=1 Tax=Mycolicibacterium mageritense TaxID=53462 RepID=A0AAI8XJB9_MYCME|nr:esterase [Mycolicibacterium mageritense]MBN3456039.1 hypothetical protein [Mycobacterium sp. DSM 3803]OKH64003.1 esterase [Mycobacterium sp. SWH-M3]MCC9181650.1 hypothetical protein [Mycolicibacterium mageritense]TXI60311.1 MAG: esterase [Mycolicibacterium mageritense]BBX34157.1 hypothetical protein MMAGJ_34390 [Mycolicibacterium mageritense]